MVKSAHYLRILKYIVLNINLNLKNLKNPIKAYITIAIKAYSEANYYAIEL